MESETFEKKSRSGRRNRRRAKDLNGTKILEVKRDFDITRSTLEAAQNHLLPRAEAVDCALLVIDGKVEDLRIDVAHQLREMRREMGMASSSTGARPFLIRRSA